LSCAQLYVRPYFKQMLYLAWHYYFLEVEPLNMDLVLFITILNAMSLRVKTLQ